MLISKEKYEVEIDKMAKASLDDICTSGNAREVNYEELKKLFIKIYE